MSHGSRIWALEVKSGRPGKASGLAEFRRRYSQAKVWMVGAGGIALEEFFSRAPNEWFR